MAEGPTQQWLVTCMMKQADLHNNDSAGQVQPPSQQATRHARRIYVGGLPPTANEQNIATFFSNALAAVGGTTAGPGKRTYLPPLHSKVASSPSLLAFPLPLPSCLPLVVGKHT